MNNYSINISWSDKDQGFIATIPEFKNLSAFGKTYEDALEQAKTVLDAYIEVYIQDGETLPEPNKISSYSGQVRLRMPKDMHHQLASQAQKQGVSLNTYMVSLLAVNHGIVKAGTSKEYFFIRILESKSETKAIQTENRLSQISDWQTTTGVR